MNTRILISLMIIGLVGAGLGSTTMAMFNDTETSQGNEFVAGALDLTVGWEETYNGETIQTQELMNDPGAIFQLDDLKPGDHGEATIDLHLHDNPGWIWMNLDQTANWDNSCTEPEHKASDGNCGTYGELDQELEFEIWSKDGDSSDRTVLFEGTAEELEDQKAAQGILLDGDSSTDEVEAFEGGQISQVGIDWNLPIETGNHIQTDSLHYELEFYTEQRRHNDNPESPWGDSEEESEDPVDDPEYSGDLTFNDQVISEEGEVTINNVSTGQDSTVFVTYESEEGTVNAGAHNAPNLDEFNPMNVEIEEEGVPGSYSAHVVPKKYVSGYDGSGGIMSESTLEAAVYTESAQITAQEEEQPTVSADLTFNDQTVDEGEVVINNVSTTVDTTVMVTYEDGDNTVAAGFHNAPADLDNFNPMNVGIDESAVPGEYTARMIEKPTEGYSPGDVLHEDTLEKQYFSQSAQISAAEDSEEESEEETGESETSNTLSFSDQTVTEEGTVEVSEVTTNQASTVFVTYESEDGLVNAGAHGATDLEEFDGMTVELEGPERSGQYAAHIIPTQNISSAYDSGDTLSESTASASLFAETADITGLESGSSE